MSAIEFKSSPSRLHGERKERIDLGERVLNYHVPFLDDCLRGILPHDLVLIGAPTGMGKTDLALSIAGKNAIAGKRVHYFALEAERSELERRTKYALLSYLVHRMQLPRANDLTYSDWLLGRCEDIVGDLDGRADSQIAAEYQTLFTAYRGTSFNAEDLARSIIAVHRETDLLVVDHLHYVDAAEDEDEHRALGDTVKTIRDVALNIGKPIILVAHLRKRDPRSRQVIAGIDDFHGSSNITKICTQVITIERAADVEAPAWFLSPTYMAILKDRRGGAPRLVAVTNFDLRLKTYSANYTLGRINGANWEEIMITDRPSWAHRHTPISGGVL